MSPVIFAPHGDDEIIGCFEILDQNPTIVYDAKCSLLRLEEIRRLQNFKKVKQYFVTDRLPEEILALTKDSTFYFPDPIYETHPLHRKIGALGEDLARKNYNVIFYTTNMNAPYIHECKDPEGKKSLLDLVYTGQSSLWKYDHKYFLFEGRCKWIF